MTFVGLEFSFSLSAWSWTLLGQEFWRPRLRPKTQEPCLVSSASDSPESSAWLVSVVEEKEVEVRREGRVALGKADHLAEDLRGRAEAAGRWGKGQCMG